MPTRLIDKRISQKKISGSPKKILMAATGGRVYTSGSYKVHVFTSSDSFQVLYTGSASTKFEYFIVSGGQAGESGGDGDGGRQAGSGGGGGSGSWAYGLNQTVSSFFNRNTSYTVTIGGGGSRSSFAYKSGTIFSNTDFKYGGAGGGGEFYNDPPDPPDPESQPGGNGEIAAITSPSIDLGLGPYTHYCGGGGGGGGGGGAGGGQGGRQFITPGTSGDGGVGGDYGTDNAGDGYNGAINSGDGGGGGGGGGAYISGPTLPGGLGGTGGSGIAFFKYQYQET